MFKPEEGAGPIGRPLSRPTSRSSANPVALRSVIGRFRPLLSIVLRPSCASFDKLHVITRNIYNRARLAELKFYRQVGGLADRESNS